MRYGSYETIKGLAHSEGKAVFLAGDKTLSGYAAKVYYLDHYAGNDPARIEKFNDWFYASVEAQKKAALNSSFVAPILQYGQDDKSDWYITQLYNSSVEKILATKIPVDVESFYNIIFSIVRGALDMKKITGRSHGNLKPSNVLVNSSGKIIKIGQVVLCDPQSGNSSNAEKFELADLRAVGEMMYRLVYPHETREIDLQKIPLMPTSAKWRSLFGNNAERWFEIFNRLLDRGLTLEKYSLDQLEADLVKLKPQAKASSKVALVATAAVIVISLGIFAFIQLNKKQPAASQAAAKPAKPAGPDFSKIEAQTKKLLEEANRRQAEEKRKLEQAKKIESQKTAEFNAAVDSKAREQAQQKIAEAEKAKEEATRKIAEEEKKAKELMAELERQRKKVEQEAAETARLRQEAEAQRLVEERKAKELAAELERQQKEKELATQKIAEAEASRQAQEAKVRELSARLEQEQKDAEAKRLAAFRETALIKTVAPVNTAKTVEPAEPLEAQLLTRPKRGEPWVNSLGQRFLPAGSSQILFCAWETRKKDFEEFAKAARYTSVGWKTVSFKQSGAHPVVNVDWNDAEAFCKWLTQSERAKGMLDDRQFYRLPTDAEWSEAAGNSSFLWGNVWPPPTGSGNFPLTYSYDRFDYTSPVGQFFPNGHGLHDMAGNVWEMCENGRNSVVGRGGSWLTASPEQMTASYRLPLRSNERREDVGFRCVLDLGN